MQTRRETIKQSMVVAGLLASAGFPQFAHAAFNKTGFDAKSVQDAVKAYGGGAIAESKDVSITGPDIAENGAGSSGREYHFARRQTNVGFG